MQAFIPGNACIGKGESRHETTLFEPRNGTKGSQKENTLHGGKYHKTFGEHCVGTNVALCPCGLLFHTCNFGMCRKEPFTIL
jgi:hypothetical protein